MALGFSTVAYEGNMDPKVFTVKKDLEDTLKALGDALRNRDTNPMIVTMKARRKGLAAKITQATTPEDVEAAWRAFSDADQALKVLTTVADRAVTTLQSKRKTLAKQIRELDTQRYGGRLGVAGAWSWSVPERRVRRCDPRPARRLGDALVPLEAVEGRRRERRE